MPVRRDATGNCSVEAQVDVPGTPEDIWSAIATGLGISQWFVPSEVEGRIGGTAVRISLPMEAWIRLPPSQLGSRPSGLSQKRRASRER